MIISFKRSQQKNGKVKAYAKVQSHDGGEVYSVVYIRTDSFRGWLCGCENFLFQKFARNKHCKHIDEVTETYGRYGVPKATLKVGGKAVVLACVDATELIGRKGNVLEVGNSVLMQFPGWTNGHNAGGVTFGESWFLNLDEVKAIN